MQVGTNASCRVPDQLAKNTRKVLVIFCKGGSESHVVTQRTYESCLRPRRSNLTVPLKADSLIAFRDFRRLFAPWANSHPGGQFLGTREGGRLRAHLGYDLLRRIGSQTGQSPIV